MVRVAFIMIVLTAMAFPCLAGVGFLGMYADAEGNTCNLIAHGGGALISTYVVHRFLPGDAATGCRFGIEGPSTGMMFLTFQSEFGGIPAAQADISIGYGTCVTAKTHIGTALWISTAEVPSCEFVLLKPADSVSGIIIADCSFGEHSIGFAVPLVVNEDVTCFCEGATEPSTWGSVKALYR